MKQKIRDWKTWALALWAGVVGGFANSGTVWLGMIGVEKMGVADMPQLNLKSFFLIAGIGAVSHALAYLKQSPIPPEVEIDDGKPPLGSLPNTITALLCGLSLIGFTGCAYTTQSIRTEATGTNGVAEVRTTRNRAVAWGDARQVIEKLKLTNGKTQAIGVTGLESEATTTNLAPNIRAFVELLNALKNP